MVYGKLGIISKVSKVCNYLLFVFKLAVSRDFLSVFFLESNPPCAPEKQIKMVLLKNSFARRYSNFKFEKFVSAHC